MLTHLLPHRIKAWLLTAMAIMLLGIQVLQYSPLHDHKLEVDDCALCHIQPLGDDTEYDHSLPEIQLVAITLALIEHTSAPPQHLFSPYQGRAPPFASL